MYTIDGSDFLEITTPLPITIPASPPTGNVRKTCLEFSVIDDSISEENESFALSLDFRENEILIDPSVTEVFIYDSDGIFALLVVCRVLNASCSGSYRFYQFTLRNS